jgi:nucleolar GTP-binding protein
VFDLPTVRTADALLDTAFRRAAKVQGKGRTRVEKARSTNVARLRSVIDRLATALTGYVKAFPSFERLPPFYRELADVVVGVDALRQSLGRIHGAARTIRRVGREATRRVAAAETAKEMKGQRLAAYGRLASIVKRIDGDLERLRIARRELRGLPAIDPRLPTLVVAGSPNVGKSEFVRFVSSAAPKVADYPFTTQRLSVGHFEREGVRFQILDTPGLLDRPMEERNPIERQAVAALRHVAHAIVFLLDPSETCGYPFDQQLRLLAAIRNAFPDTPILDVETKVDIHRTDSPRTKVSAATGEGVGEVLRAATARATSRVPEAAPPEPAG